MLDICCIGHITSDKVVTTHSVNYMPGGTAYYFSYALSKLDVNYLLVTSLASKETRYVDEMRANGIDVDVKYGENTVYFENIYGANPDERRQNVLQKADPFSIEQIAGIDAGIFHLGPLLPGDIPPEMIKMLAAKGRISLDVQGYLRKVVDKKVYPCGWADKKEILPYVTILKVDEAELAALTGYANVDDGAQQVSDWGVKQIVATNGGSGSAIYAEGKKYIIPAYRPPMVVDATGCGDTYMAGYLYQLTKGHSIEGSGRFAAAMAGLKTKSAGPYKGNYDDITRFLQQG